MAVLSRHAHVILILILIAKLIPIRTTAGDIASVGHESKPRENIIISSSIEVTPHINLLDTIVLNLSIPTVSPFRLAAPPKKSQPHPEGEPCPYVYHGFSSRWVRLISIQSDANRRAVGMLNLTPDKHEGASREGEGMIPATTACPEGR